MRLLLTGGTVVDGTGIPGVRADVLVENGRIASVGGIPENVEAERIDCSNCVVAPGFIDIHSHSDLQAHQDKVEKARQGVTTEVVGNCSFSAFPAAEERSALHEFANSIFCGSGDWGWHTAKEYYADAAKGPGRVNPLSLVGHGTLRISEVGLKQGPLAPAEMDAIEQRLSDCLAEGAVGFSTGLMYAPGSSAPFEELERLCRVVARHGKLYATHMRSYFGGILESIDEQLELARRSGCRLQISHLQIAGRKNWDLQRKVIDKIERAHRQGIDVAFDCYPYVAGSTVLTQILPQSALEGGIAAMLARFADPAARARIASETLENLAWAWSDVYISAVASARNASLVGKSLEEISKERQREPVQTVMDLLAEENGAVNMLCFNQSEENLRQTLAHPLSMIGSDGFYVKGRPHPRLAGTFPKLLGYYTRQEKLFSLEEAIRKITSIPAERLRLNGRGVLAPGNAADIVVFHPQEVAGPADYENPEVPPTGIRYVFRNGNRTDNGGR
ncbi:MAG: D-aminoacylase [Bryobacteraceae bacterium]|nr:D-aminoacylase [Bryobacterales bacterium]MEB2361027.1 D-aminoacylase [Bryobacterales bacterium]NUM99575.1 D-aminoacylase [Bryobacteraceae bacterium]